MPILLCFLLPTLFACAYKLNPIQPNSGVHGQQSKAAKIALARATADRETVTVPQFGLYQRKLTDNLEVQRLRVKTLLINDLVCIRLGLLQQENRHPAGLSALKVIETKWLFRDLIYIVRDYAQGSGWSLPQPRLLLLYQ